MDELDDAIKMEKMIGKMAELLAEVEAKRLDAVIMGIGVDVSPSIPTGSFIMDVPVIKSVHVPEDAIYTIEKVPSLRFDPEITIEYDKKYDVQIVKSVGKFASLPLFYGDYVSLIDRLEIKLFTWPKYIALVLLVISLIAIMLLVAK